MNDRDYERENDDWERRHNFMIKWRCPECDYSYESPLDVNEALKCRRCGERTVNVGESYLG